MLDRIRIVAIIITLILAGAVGAKTNINTCTPISSPGEYVLNQNIGNFAVTTCIEITSKDVIIDGASHYIIGNFAMSGTYGIKVNNATNALTNVTIKNLTVTNWGNGIYFNNVKNGRIVNNNVSSNILAGIFLGSSSENIIYNNYFNNVNNFVFTGMIYNNTWNITKTPGTNIVGGPYIGGNFWAYPNGSGFSNTCSDSNRDGICELNYSLNKNNVDYLPLTNKPINDIAAPESITNLKNISYATTYINWTWIDPKTSDFTKVMVYINGKFKTNVTKGVQYYRAISLIPNITYTISTHTVDTSGNINKTWRNHTAKTARDAIPPASISNLKNISYARNYIKWNWTDPSDVDFTKVMVYINGKFKTNVSKGVKYYNATSLIPNTLYTINTHTVDTSGNINKTWRNHTAKTAP